MRRCGILAVLFLTCTAMPGFAQGDKKKDAMPELTPLWTGDAPGALGKAAVDIPGIYLYPAPADKAVGSAVVVCPGGGYGGLAMDHEGKQIAAWLNGLGVTAAVLKYRLGSAKYRHPVELGDAQRALRTVRSKAAVLKVDAKKIGILGFSAGGHLASTAATHFDAGNADADDPIERVSCRPDFAVLCYAVITLEPPHAHMGSRYNLLGKDADEKLVASLCNDKMVTKETPPTFLVHTTEDKAVPAENSVLFYLACMKHHVPAEMHIFEKGQHGLGMGPANLPFSAWPGLCEAWMRGRGVLPAAKK
jgi:acetyl esterase/lipase